MVTAIIGAASAAAGLTSNIYGYYKAGQQAKKQEALIKQAQDRADSYYNRNYYSDYFASAEAQNAMRRVQQSLQRTGEAQRGRQAINGSTDEAALAEREQGMQAVADTASNLSSQSTSLKRDADKTHEAALNSIDAQRMGLAGQKMEGYAQLAANGANLMASGIKSVASGIGTTRSVSGAGMQSSAADNGEVEQSSATADTTGVQSNVAADGGGLPNANSASQLTSSTDGGVRVNATTDDEARAIDGRRARGLIGLAASADGTNW